MEETMNENRAELSFLKSSMDEMIQLMRANLELPGSSPTLKDPGESIHQE